MYYSHVNNIQSELIHIIKLLVKELNNLQSIYLLNFLTFQSYH